MTYSITIRQKGGLFKNAPDLAALKKQFSSAFHIGGIGRYFEFLDEPGAPGEGLQAAYMLYGTGSPLGRGFYLYIHEDFAAFEVTTPMPTTAHDMVDMFTFAEHLAKYLGAKTVEDEFGTYPLTALPSLYPDILRKNLEGLKSYAISRPGFSVSGVRFPVQVPSIVCGRIGGVPLQGGEKFFSACLDESQRTDIDYLTPDFYRDETTGEALGRYAIREDHSVIIPKTPFIPYGPAPFGEEPVAAWQAALVTDQLGTLGSLPYGLFLERLGDTDTRDFDDRHYVLHALSLNRLQQILEGT